MRVDDGPYLNLLSKRGWHDLRWAGKHWGWNWDLLLEAISDTWFGIKFRYNKLRH